MAQHYRTKFGPQPIRDAVWRAGYTHSEFRELTGIRPSSHVWLAIVVRCPPSADLRRMAKRILGLPLGQLFTDEALSSVHQPSRAPRRPKTLDGARVNDAVRAAALRVAAEAPPLTPAARARLRELLGSVHSPPSDPEHDRSGRSLRPLSPLPTPARAVSTNPLHSEDQRPRPDAGATERGDRSA